VVHSSIIYEKIILITFLILLHAHLAFAESSHVAKAIIARGEVKAKLKDGSIIDVKEGTEIPEGAVIQTAEKVL